MQAIPVHSFTRSVMILAGFAVQTGAPLASWFRVKSNRLNQTATSALLLSTARQKSLRHPHCTNIPINCPHCKETIWKYNAVDHVITNHPGLNAGNLDKQFVVDMQIQEEEERRMKVSPELTGKYRNEHKHLLLSGEELSVVKRECEQEQKRTKKRPRSTVVGWDGCLVFW